MTQPVELCGSLPALLSAALPLPMPLLPPDGLISAVPHVALRKGRSQPVVRARIPRVEGRRPAARGGGLQPSGSYPEIAALSDITGLNSPWL